jgi:hypothetical protein
MQNHSQTGSSSNQKSLVAAVISENHILAFVDN